MSLINEALKKAQRQRAEAPDQAGTESSSSANTAATPLPARRRKHVAAQTVVLVSVGSVLLLIVGGIAAYILFSHENIATPAIASAARPALPAPPATTPAPEEVTQLPVIAPPTPPPIPTQPTPDPTPVAALPTPAPIPTLPVAVSVPPLATPTPAPTPERLPAPVQATNVPADAPVKADPRVYVFIGKIRVAGIRASDSDPRVLMNDRMYRLNDLVAPDLQLRLTGITSLALTFTDANGIVYTRNF